MQPNLEAFLKVIDPQDNATGGGSASAIAGAMAAALVGMVARLSIGKAGLREAAHYQDLNLKAQTLAEELLRGAETDSNSFNAVSAAFKLPKETDEQKAARSQAIQSGWVHATEVPLENANSCLLVLQLAAQLQESFNTNAASDLECAQHLTRAGMRGCLANAAINLPSIKDQAIAASLQGRKDLLEAALEDQA